MSCVVLYARQWHDEPTKELHRHECRGGHINDSPNYHVCYYCGMSWGRTPEDHTFIQAMLYPYEQWIVDGKIEQIIHANNRYPR